MYALSNREKLVQYWDIFQQKNWNLFILHKIVSFGDSYAKDNKAGQTVYKTATWDTFITKTFKV